MQDNLQRILTGCFALLERFERWFDRRYGWFFTNGMKQDQADRSDLRA